MGWKKYFKAVDTTGNISPISGAKGGKFGFKNYQSRLPEVYSGHPNRVNRYNQYEAMDMDSEISACLDIISEFSTQDNDQNSTPFDVNYHEKPTDNEVKIIEQQLKQWCKLNQFKKRIFKLFRNTLKYGDQVFVRDPETFELFWIDMSKVNRVIVNESKGKEPDQYVIQDINPNFENLTVATKTTDDFGITPLTGGINPQQQMANLSAPSAEGTRFGAAQRESTLDAKHIVHLSLTEGLDVNWPFGTSILENIFKVFKQKELLEDAILIYRVQRAPERRVFYIDVGNMPSHMAMSFVERVKNEIHQRRIPTQSGGGDNMLDATYNPLSQNEDYFFPQCLSQNTKIPLLDGRTLTLQEVIKEYNEGKTNYAYSLNLETQGLEPGKITWGGITRKDAELVRVTLDNGEYIDATPDHRFILRDGTECQAQNLKSNDSLMPLYLKKGKTSPKQKNNGYMRYIDNGDGKTKWVHTAICPKTEEGKKYVIHHKDFNSENNNPDNLDEMLAEDHIELHKSIGTYSLQKQWNDPNARSKLINGIRKYHANATSADKQMMIERGIKNGSKTWSNKESASKVIKSLKETQKRVSKQKTIQISDEMFDRLREIYDDGFDSISKICPMLRNDKTFQLYYRKANPNIIRDKNRPTAFCPTDRSLHKIVQVGGYNNWSDFKQEYKVNHKVVSIEVLPYVEDTCDITVESPSNSHIFATDAGVYVHNSAEGRGSKVDTLPGGENLGQIDDLRYFNNKLARGLRVPSSYLPSGPEDNAAPLNDGRLGTALIQEYRFNQYCIRLQNTIGEMLNKEFKMFLAWRGFNIDASLFDISFGEPQNFASYRQTEQDASRVGTFSTLEAYPYLSKRFLLERYLGLSEEEMTKNDELWAEENKETEEIPTEGSDLRGVGVMPGGMEGDIGMADDLDMMGEMPEGEMGPEGGMPPEGVPEAPVPPPV